MTPDAIKALGLVHVGWQDEFGNLFPLGAYNGISTYWNGHKDTWQYVYGIPIARRIATAKDYPKCEHDITNVTKAT